MRPGRDTNSLRPSLAPRCESRTVSGLLHGLLTVPALDRLKERPTQADMNAATSVAAGWRQWVIDRSPGRNARLVG